uniref:Uncharacterized protein n=1 Tax=Amphiprion percula TaxID=161767 RepID=A0A3P8RHQ9_AMPPE
MKTSLDRCIQTALASLYPPFQVTSPTVLCQVLSVVEHCYRGDGLRYLIHFLLPAKNFLQNLQQDACVQYCGLLFRHEGWPLCVHEKIVVQLCPLDQHLLRPGDFYLLVSPAPRLLLCSWAGRHVEQQEVSQLALRSLFSMAWLDSVNRDRERRGAPRLERLLLAAHGDVFRVPWEDLVYPQFISRPRPPREDQDGLMNSSRLSSGQDGKLLPLTKTDQSAASSDGEDSEGEYVELMDLPVFLLLSLRSLHHLLASPLRRWMNLIIMTLDWKMWRRRSRKLLQEKQRSFTLKVHEPVSPFSPPASHSSTHQTLSSSSPPPLIGCLTNSPVWLQMFRSLFFQTLFSEPFTNSSLVDLENSCVLFLPAVSII